MFCHEGPWHKVDRIWTIRTDGSGLTKIHTRTMNMEIAVHEFFSADGKTIWYDLQTAKSQVMLGPTHVDQLKCKEQTAEFRVTNTQPKELHDVRIKQRIAPRFREDRRHCCGGDVGAGGICPCVCECSTATLRNRGHGRPGYRHVGAQSGPKIL
jgi:hypothetical protein